MEKTRCRWEANQIMSAMKTPLTIKLRVYADMYKHRLHCMARIQSSGQHGKTIISDTLFDAVYMSHTRKLVTTVRYTATGLRTELTT
jgi:hypothetical protein